MYPWGDDAAVCALYSGYRTTSCVYRFTSVVMLPSGCSVVSDGMSVTTSKTVVMVAAPSDTVMAVNLAEM